MLAAAHAGNGDACLPYLHMLYRKNTDVVFPSVSIVNGDHDGGTSNGTQTRTSYGSLFPFLMKGNLLSILAEFLLNIKLFL
jgi:hypothetical protein